MAEKGVEATKPAPMPFLRQVFDQAGVTDEVANYPWQGSGTEEDPYVVGWIPNDPRDPMLYSKALKWFITMLVAIATLAVSFVSSGYTGGADEILRTFHIGTEVYTLGISLFVLGFALGPLIWAPLSELFGRQILYFVTYAMLTFFNAGAAGSQNIQTLVILRFFAGAFGSSPLTNSGGVIADCWAAKERGLALTIFAAAPAMGPVLGPIVGSFVGETIGWRWVEGVMAIFTGVLWIAATFLVPETYAPVIHRKRAAKLSKMTGKVYKSRADVDQGPTTFGHVFAMSLSRPWILLFKEPIVLLLSIYMAIIYGTLYMLFAAYPIVYQETRGWSSGISSLAFLGVAVGMVIAVIYSIWDNKRYGVVSDKHNGFAPPEARLPPTMVGGIAIPIGLFWFAWTNYPSINYMASISAGAPFGFGLILIFLGIMNYLIDSYTIFAASVLASNAMLRSVFGAVFPLFTTYMYESLGIHWASTIPAFLALACTPMPFLFYRYGAAIRKRCKYTAQSEAFLRKLQDQVQDASNDNEDVVGGDEEARIGTTGAGAKGGQQRATTSSVSTMDVETEKDAAIDLGKEHEEEREQPEMQTQQEERADGSFEGSDGARLAPIRTAASVQSFHLKHSKSYEGNPFDLDRVNTRESFKGSSMGRERSSSRASGRSGASGRR